MWELVLYDPYGDRYWEANGLPPQLLGVWPQLYAILRRLDTNTDEVIICVVRRDLERADEAKEG